MPNATIANLADNATAEYRRLVWRAASGEEVTPEDAIATAVAAGYSATDLNRHVEEVEQRIQLHAEFHAADYEGRRAEAVAERNAAHEALPKAKEVFAKAQADLQEASDRLGRGGNAVNRLIQKQDEDRRTLQDFMRKTGIQPDASDPKNFRLS